MKDAWPLFGLRIRTGRVELPLPTEDELFELAEVAAGAELREVPSNDIVIPAITRVIPASPLPQASQR